MSHPDQLLSANDIAREVSVCPETVRRWMSTGQLKVERYGTRIVRVRRSELNRFLEWRRLAS